LFHPESEHTDSRQLTEIQARAGRGERLDAGAGLVLFQRSDLDVLGEIARAVRQLRVPGNLVTYLVDRNINYTNVCITDCQFCAFYRPPGHAESYVNSHEALGEKIQALVDVGGTRILMQGGHHPDLRIEWYEDLLRWIRATFPTIEVDAFSPSEIQHIADLEQLGSEDVLRRLQDAGLAGLPGGGAEILDDAVRRRISPKKQDTAGWLGVMAVAQRLGLATSASMVIGFGETLEQRITHLIRLRDHQQQALATHGNGFTAFIMWTAQIDNTPLERSRHRQSYGADTAEYLRQLALCRVMLDNFEHLQASWPTMGPAVARQALEFGADDYGSTMLEENVVSAAGTTRTSMDAAEIRRQIRLAGFQPAQRDTRYRTLRVFPATEEDEQHDLAAT
jgi:cyclic dehypoxanthinyl futalosine synthase